jgi:hypothetical protein
MRKEIKDNSGRARKKTICGIIPYLLFMFLLSSCLEKSANKNVYQGSGSCYYISPSGNDQNPGTKLNPWKTIGKINKTNLYPGDTLLFEGGANFAGTLIFDSLDSGMEGKIVTIGSYGNGRAYIDGGNSEGIIVRNCSYFIISDLIVIGSGRKDGNLTDGVSIINSGNFTIDSLELFGFQHSGLLVYSCSDVRITNVYAHDNGFAGIHITGKTINDPAKYDNANVYIGFCIAANNPGDPTVTGNHSGNGILASSVKGGTIEYSKAFNNGWDMPWTGNGPVGIWIWDCTDFKIQYCISYDNKTRAGAGDGGGFDLDGGVSNSIIQYCLSYNNQGAGYGLFEFGAAKPWENNTIRYNISINDAIYNTGSIAVWRNETGGTMRNCEIYNNTFYNNTSRGYAIAFLNNWPGFKFRNNIFVYKNSFLIPEQKLASELFQSNSYFSLSGDQTIAGFRNLQEWARATGNEILNNRILGLYTDPEFNNPAGCSLTDPMMLDPGNLSTLYPGTGSQLIDMGLDLNKLFNLEQVTKDIAGTSLPQGAGYDIGALENVKKK